MTTRTLLIASLFAALSSAGVQAQTTVDFAATSNGASTVYVLPGDDVDYEIEAQLGGDPSQGLAMFAVDLSFTGGDLTAQADAPGAGPLLQFVAPLGFNNPAGYGGTLRNGDLLQVGGAMNTIANQFAPTPSGIVVTGVADGAAVEVATGSLTAPTTPGTYQLVLSNVFANALDAQDPLGFWRVRPAESAATTPLVVEVLDCGAVSYCVGKVGSTGCAPTVSGTGMASTSGASSLTITAADVVNGQTGLFVWSRTDGQIPVFGGTLCLGSPMNRMLEIASSGGAGAPGTTCGGTYTRTIDAAFLASAGLVVGETLHCQWVFRDPMHPDGTGAGLTAALRVMVCP